MRRTIVLVCTIFAVAASVPSVGAHHRDGHRKGGSSSGEGGGTVAPAAYDDAACTTTPVAWTDDPCAGRQWGLERVDAPGAWGVTRGEGTTVAVVDTGVDTNHPDLAANLDTTPGSNILENTSYVCPWMKPGKNTKSSSAIGHDDHGHGTHVAGTVAAIAGNGEGVAGVAPGAKILPVKVLDASGSGSDADVARGICFSADHGADVINLSLGFDPVVSIVISGIGSDTNRAIEYAYSKGSAVIAAAGNESFPLCGFPAATEMAICVGATDQNDLKPYYSNFGNVDVVAPGGAGSVFCEHSIDVWSTMLPGSSFDCGGNGYESLAGTSMATPHAAAVAALIASRFGGTPDQVYSRLIATTDDLGAPGYDPAHGHGRVNARKAVGA